ncbi:MAG: SGNH/GDSL hydrolase family protein [Pseudomonadales bacterium]
MKQRIKNIGINTLLLVVFTLLSLLMLEQGFRCWLFGWKAFDYTAMKNNAPISNTDFMRQSPFDDIYWALKPNLDTSFKLAHLTTNSFGLADKEYALAKPANHYRIAVLGDSYSMASGVDTDKSFHAVLENNLNTHASRPYELINFAVGGFGLERYNATLEHLVPTWQPDAILLGFCAFNDQVALPPKTGSVPPFNPYIANGFLNSYVREYLKLQNADKKAFQIRATTTYRPKDIAFIDQQLGEMRRLANAIKPDMPILLAYLDNREHSAKDIADMAALAQKHNILFVDTTQPFHNTNIDDHSIYLLDSHPNTEAHASFADTLFAAIQREHFFDFSARVSTP